MTKFTTNIRNLGLLLTSFLLLFFGVDAMAGIFGSNTLFSEVEGVVIIDDKPCSAAKIEQKVYMANNKEITNVTNTSEDGRFSFQEISQSKGLFSFLPSEFVATQRLVIHLDGKEYLGWANTKRSPEQNSESNGKAFSLICDLSKKPEEDDKYQGICRLNAN